MPLIGHARKKNWRIFDVSPLRTKKAGNKIRNFSFFVFRRVRGPGRGESGVC